MAVRRNLAWMALGQMAFFLIQFGGTVVLARVLSPYEMGVYAVGAAIVGILTLLQAFGLGNFIVREASLDSRHVATAFTINAFISVVLSALIFAVSFFTRYWAPDTGVALVLRALAIIPLISIFQLIPYAQLERRGMFKWLVAVNMTRQLIATFCTVSFALTGYSYLSLPLGQICGGVAGALLVNILGREHIQLRFSLADWRRISVFGAEMLAISGVNSLATRVSEVALGKISGLANLGLYTRASTLFSLFWDNLHLIVGRVLFVDLAERKRRGESLRDAYLMIAEITTAVLWPAFVGLAVLSRPLFAIVYGEKWVPAAIPFSILAASAVAQASVTMTWELFAVSGETRRQTKIEFLRTAVGVTLFVGGCFISLTAAAVARLLDAIFSAAIYRPHVQRMTDTRFSDLLPIYARSMGLSFGAVCPATALMIAQRGSPSTPAWQVGLAILAGVAFWLVAVIMLKHPIYREGSRALARVRQRRASSGP